MRTAQQLYEGVELGGEGSVALITYMRTDSTRIADEAIAACREHIRVRHGDAYVPEQPLRYAASKDAQGAHEAIRPTDLAYTPERVSPYLSPEQLRLYALIYHRFVACQMMPALFDQTTIDVAAQGKNGLDYVFRATGSAQSANACKWYFRIPTRRSIRASVSSTSSPRAPSSTAPRPSEPARRRKRCSAWSGSTPRQRNVFRMSSVEASVSG